MSSAWGDFLKARHRLIHEWARDGIPGGTEGSASAEQISAALNHNDPVQVKSIMDLPLDQNEMNLEQIAFRMTMDAMKQHGRNKTKAARALGIGRTTLHRRLVRYRNEGKIK